MDRFVMAIQPKALIIAETEIWPNLIRTVKNTGAKIAIINGSMSEKSSRLYSIFKPLTSSVLKKVDFLGVKSEKERARYLSFGIDKSRIEVIGNIKFSLNVEIDRSVNKKNAAIFKKSAASLLFVAGCTRPGEESLLVNIIPELIKNFNNLIIIIAPRHLDRINEIENLLKSSNIDFENKSNLDEINTLTKRVVLLDSMGELISLYSIADIAFVGGSLIDYGGHNPLEPAACGIPVLFGPHMRSNIIGANKLLKQNGAFQCTDIENMKNVLLDLLSNQSKRTAMGRNALNVIKNNSKIAHIVMEYLKNYKII